MHISELSEAQFISKVRAHRFERRIQVTGQFSHTRSCGYDYVVYVSLETLEPINPFQKKNKGVKHKGFSSAFSAEHAKRLAFEFIKKNVQDY